MARDRRAWLLVLMAGLTLLATFSLVPAASAVAQSGGGTSNLLSTGYELTWSSVDCGGYTFSKGGGYTLGGTIGQPDAGQLTGGGYALGGGFWGGGVPAVTHDLHLPLVLRQF